MKRIRSYCYFLVVLSLTLFVMPAVRGQGAAGYALSFNSANSNYVSFNGGALNGTFTVEMWVKLTAPPASGGAAFIGSRSPQDNSFDFKYKPNGPLHGDIGNGTNWITTTADAPAILQTNVWYHLAYVVMTNGYSIYQDGVQLTNASFPSATPLLFDFNHLLTLGRAHPNEYFTGEMDDVRIWNVARTTEEILADKNYRLTGGESGLVQYYRFDEGSGTTINDSAPAISLNTGTLVNSPTFVPSTIPGFSAGPWARTSGGVSINPSVSKLGGVYNPHGNDTLAWFEWGTTTNYGNVTRQQNVGNGLLPAAFSEIITNLNPAFTYHARAVASNAFGVTLGDDKIFPEAAPALKAQRQGSTVVFSWPMTTPAFLLEQATNISSTNWTALYGATVSNDKYVVNLANTNAAGFFRLKQIVNGPVQPIIFGIHPNLPSPDDWTPVDVCPIVDEFWGCLYSKIILADFAYIFDASACVDPNRRPNDPAPTFKWQIFFSEADGGLEWLYPGIQGSATAVLTIQPDSLPVTVGPLSEVENQWRFLLTITHQSTDPFSTGTMTTTVPFRVRYANSQLPR